MPDCSTLQKITVPRVLIFSVTLDCQTALVVAAHSEMPNATTSVLQAEEFGPNMEVHVPGGGDSADRGA
jgi:hypothetical protein